MKTREHGFTLIELLVTITIIGILAGMMFGAYAMARNAGREYATKATIAKLNTIIMQRYESYMTRRVAIKCDPCPTAWPSGTPLTDPEKKAWFVGNLHKRLDAIRDLMRMEMPDSKSDIINGPVQFIFGGDGSTWSLPEPALHRLYAGSPPTANLDPAQCLYKLVSMGSPEAMEQFNQNEIGMVDGKPVFVDGWGMPIMWLRWAPGFTSPIQSGNAVTDHDPFDTRNLESVAFHLIPLIYSAAGKRKADGTPMYGIDLQAGYVFAGNPYANLQLGKPIAGEGAEGNITNHYIEQR
jgi:prepilin-type N-terminal cleavage/methylation domain-containing protein